MKREIHRISLSLYLLSFHLFLSLTSGFAQNGGLPYRPEKIAGIIPQQPYERYQTTDKYGRTIFFYVSEEPRTPTLPLLVYVHGSGAMSHFVRNGNRVVGSNGHSTVRDVAAGKVRLVILEKPGVDYLSTPSPRGSAVGSSATFRFEHTLERWAEAVNAAMRAARQLEGVDSNRVLVAGHSEGGIVAALVASDHTLVTHIAMLAGGGPSQLYDLLELARRGTFFSQHGTTPEEREQYVLNAWKRIQTYPENSDSLFFGHPYKRWSSFLTQSPMELLEHTRAKIYLTQGTQDDVVTLESFHMLCGQLISHNADVTYDLVKGADHNFAHNSAQEPIDGWLTVWAKVLAWYLGQ